MWYGVVWLGGRWCVWRHARAPESVSNSNTESIYKALTKHLRAERRKTRRARIARKTTQATHGHHGGWGGGVLTRRRMEWCPHATWCVVNRCTTHLTAIHSTDPSIRTPSRQCGQKDIPICKYLPTISALTTG